MPALARFLGPDPPRRGRARARRPARAREARAEGHYQRGARLSSPPATSTGRRSSSATSSASTASTARPGSPSPGCCATRATPTRALGHYLRARRPGPRQPRGPPRARRARARRPGLRDRGLGRRPRLRARARRPGRARAEGDPRLPRRRDPTRARPRSSWPAACSPRRPASAPAHMVLIADRMNADDPAGALAQADAALAAVPADEGLHLVRLAALERLGDTAGVGAADRAHGRALPRERRRRPGPGAVAHARRATPPAPRRCCAASPPAIPARPSRR